MWTNREPKTKTVRALNEPRALKETSFIDVSISTGS